MGFLELGELRECVCVWGGREENERERKGSGVGLVLGRVGASGMGRVVGFRVKKSYLGDVERRRYLAAAPRAQNVCPFLKMTRDLLTPRSHPAPNHLPKLKMPRDLLTPLHHPAPNHHSRLE